MIIALTVLFAASNVFAQGSGGYFGARGGKSNAIDMVSASDLDAQNAASGFTTNSTIDDTDSAWKVFGGFKFTKFFPIEGSYTDFGKVTTNTAVSAPLTGWGDQNIEATTWGIAAMVTLPLVFNFDIFGKGGYHYWDAKWTANSNVAGLSASRDETGSSPFYGVGAEFNLTNKFALSAEWERYTDVGNNNTAGKSGVDVQSVGVRFMF